MTLWIASIALTVAALAALWAWPRKAHDDAPDGFQARLQVLRDRRAELDAELADGRLDEARHAEACRELETRAANELEDTATVGGNGRGTKPMYAAVAVFIPVIAFTTYLGVGGHRDMDRAAMPAATAPELALLIEQLAERMETQPDDLQGWMLLGRSSVVLGDYPRAVMAWRRAHGLAPDDPTVLANLAEALVLLDEAALQGEAAPLIERALAADPDNPKALWYGGLLAESRGEEGLAQARWRALLAQDPPEEFRRVLEERVGGPVDADFALTVTVDLADGMEAHLPERGAVLFVTLHDPRASDGPPLAALRAIAGDFPVVARITARDAMLPGTDLSAHAGLRVVARVSLDGGAVRRAGDLYGERAWRADDGAAIAVTIDSRQE